MYKYKLILIDDEVEDIKKLNSFLGQGYTVQNQYGVNGKTAFYICKYFPENSPNIDRNGIAVFTGNSVTFASQSEPLDTVNNRRW